jgi:hypothetical protein
MAAMLLEAGADANDGQAIYNRGMGDVANDDTEFLELLLAHGLGRGDGGAWYRLLDPAIGEPSELLTQALHHAAQNGLARRVRLLLGHGADPNERFPHPIFGGRSIYQSAVASGDPEVIALLEGAGADGSGVDPVERLAGALVGGDEATVARLAASDDGPLDLVRSAHPDLMRRVGALGRAEAVPVLVGHGFDVDAGGGGRTALHEAAHAGRVECIEALLAAGADPTIADDVHGGTPQGWAAFAGHAELAARLAEAEAAANAARTSSDGPPET